MTIKPPTLVDEQPTPCRCGGEIWITYDELGPFGVLHGVPPCPAFRELEPTNFLRWVRMGLKHTQQCN
jgi:hypothetical protein